MFYQGNLKTETNLNGGAFIFSRADRIDLESFYNWNGLNYEIYTRIFIPVRSLLQGRQTSN